MRPRLLIEEWLPVQAIGVECARERSTGQQPPDKRLHVWWARRPLTASRAAVLASILPADFDRAAFERLLGFGRPGADLIALRRLMDTGRKVPGGFGCGRAFTNAVPQPDLRLAEAACASLWGGAPTVLDPMAGGGSIPLEAARLGLPTLANELNPVACSVLEATVDYPLRLAAPLGGKARRWAAAWERRCAARLGAFYPKKHSGLVHAYIFARTVPCPETGNPTPLVPDWSLSHPRGGRHLVAMPVVTNRDQGRWTIEVKEVGRLAGQVPAPPKATYDRGAGLSLFSPAFQRPGGSYIHLSADYLKAMAQQGRMGSHLYAVAIKTPTGIEFRPPDAADLRALEEAERELARLRPGWERENIIPTEIIPPGDKTGTDPNLRGMDLPLKRGETRWLDLFSPRQLLALGTLVEELRHLAPEIVAAEGEETGEAVVHLLAFALEKYADYNSRQATWECTRLIVKHGFQRHDYAFKATFAEMAACVAGGGLAWAIDNVLDAYEALAALPRAEGARPATITQGTATNLVHLEDKSITAVVMDPPYADNVQYSELADFFYVWLKRTQGRRRPEWFSSYLCDRDQEAVVNLSRHRDGLPAQEARRRANACYQRLMAETFREARRVLRDDGVLTVMFTHKKQEAWEALFTSLIEAGFTITATWPVRTESEHSLHIAKKNSAESTVILVARKRGPDAGRAYYDAAMQSAIHSAARRAAERLGGLNPVDQLVGAFGPAMQEYSRYDEVRRDTGEPVTVGEAIQAAADEVVAWRQERLATRGLPEVDAESRFYLLCWDVLQAQEFRFNEAMLLGRAARMDIARLQETGLAEKSGEKVKMLPAAARRRARPIRSEQEQLALLAAAPGSRRRPSRKVNPDDEYFSAVVDMCHALAMRYADAGGGDNGLAAARGMAQRRGWGPDSPCARLMAALVNAAPPAVRFPGKKKQRTAADEFPEFRAWHAMLQPLFRIAAPEWRQEAEPLVLPLEEEEDEEAGEEEEE